MHGPTHRPAASDPAVEPGAAPSRRAPEPPEGAAAEGAGALGDAALAAAWPTLLELAGPIYVADLDGRLRYANAGFRELLARTMAPEGTLDPDLVQRSAVSSTGLRRTVRIEADGGPRLFEGRHRRVAGRALIVGVFAEVTRARDALASVRRLRARQEEILSTVSDWVWELDAGWRFRQSSTRSADVLGFDPAGLVGRDFFELGEVVPHPRAPQRRLLTRRRRAPFEQVLYRVDGPEGLRLFELSAIPQFDERTGRFRGFQGSARDVTEQIEADQRARDYRAELERTLAQLRDKNAELDAALARARAADRAKNEFLAMVGHELRTPLNAVIGFSEMMDGEVFGPLGDSRYDAYVDDILGSSRHLLDVINDIIDVVKLELHELSLQLDEIEAGRLIETCCAFVREKARRQGVELRTDVPDALPPLIVDPQKARQMLINLLGNAVKFTDEGGRVTVAARLDGEHLRLDVADTGCGIPADRLEAVLQPFQQADASLTRSHDGLGLGLPLTRQLAELHGGTMAIESVEGEGTTVTLRFPPAPAVEAG